MTHSVKTTAAIHHLLGNEVRLRIVLALAEEPRNVGALAELAGVSVSGVSQHLTKLKAVQVVTFDRDNQTYNYRLEKPIHPLVEASIALLNGGGK